MKPELVLALVVGLAGMAMAAYGLVRQRTLPQTREQTLNETVTRLKHTVETLQADHVHDQQRLTQLERDLASAKVRIRELEVEVEGLRRGQAPTLPSPVGTQGRNAEERALIVAVGADPALQVDLPALREVAAKTGMRFTRLMPVTCENLKRILDWHRRRGTPARMLHIATHADERGVQFGDGVATGVWLSEQLAGVWVLVLAGCRSSAVGDMLGVVPAVVTLLEDLTHADAWQLAAVWWQAIGEGMKPQDAWDRCHERLPASVMEMAELRCWGEKWPPG